MKDIIPFPIFVTCLVFACILGLLLFSQHHLSSPIDVIDSDLLIWVNQNHNRWLDVVMGKFSNFSFWVPFYCAVLLLMLAYDKVRFLKYLAFACIYLVVAIGCLLIFNFYFGHTTPLYDQSLLSVLKTGANGKGAPYGCLPLASVAAGFALMLTLYFRRNYLYLKIAITVWAFLVLFSRVYNTWNYPKEIAAGITLTLVLAYLAYKTYRCYLKRYAHAG